MRRMTGLFLMLWFLTSPALANGGALCTMMGQNAAPAGVSFSAPHRSCCPEGKCGCSIEAPTPHQAAVPQTLSFSGPSEADFASDSLTVLSGRETAEQDPSESPPHPDKLYKRLEQYRI